MGYHNQGRPATDVRTASLRPRTMETGLGELAQDCRAWSASVRDVVKVIGDAGSTRPGGMPTPVQVDTSTSKCCHGRGLTLKQVFGGS